MIDRHGGEQGHALSAALHGASGASTAGHHYTTPRSAATQRHGGRFRAWGVSHSPQTRQVAVQCSRHSLPADAALATRSSSDSPCIPGQFSIRHHRLGPRDEGGVRPPIRYSPETQHWTVTTTGWVVLYNSLLTNTLPKGTCTSLKGRTVSCAYIYPSTLSTQPDRNPEWSFARRLHCSQMGSVGWGESLCGWWVGMRGTHIGGGWGGGGCWVGGGTHSGRVATCKITLAAPDAAEAALCCGSVWGSTQPLLCSSRPGMRNVGMGGVSHAASKGVGPTGLALDCVCLKIVGP